MPHANMAHWRSLISGEKMEYVPMRSVEELRERRGRGAGLFEQLNVHLPEVGEMHESVVMRSSGYPKAEIYVPKGEGPFPVLLHIHGGGWFTGSALGERKLGMQYAADGFVVVNLDYRLAPEHPFPQGLEDCVYAARWIVENIERYKGDPSKLIIGGGSAGGNLSACTALALHGSDEGLDGGDLPHVKVRFSGAVLQFGVLDVPRWIFEPHYYAGISEIFVQSYLGTNFTDKMRHPLVSPIHSPHLDKLPPVYLSCGDQDAFLSHSLAMANALTLVDVSTTLSVVEDADHEFLKIPEKVGEAGPERDRIVAWMRRRTAS